MYGLPKTFNATFFVGLNVEMVCLNVNQIYVHFGPTVSLVIEAIFEFTVDGRTVLVDSLPSGCGELAALLGQSVTSAVSTEDGTLTLSLSNGDGIRCWDSSEHYECYQVRNGESITIV
jgi:hypothetical protein